MFGQTVFHNIADLPMDVLSLVDDKFYDFVQEKLGSYQSTLLKIQQINSVACFLLTSDPCEILNLCIDDDDLKLLKKHVCFLLSDGSYVVKPGVQSGFKCLRDLLTKKTEEKLKQVRSSRPQAPLNNSTNTPTVSTFVSVSPFDDVSPQPQMAPTAVFRSDGAMTIIDHRRYVLNLLKQWCSSHRDDLSVATLDLKEGKDFNLNVSFDQNGDLQSSVKCKCNRSITLTIKNGKIQLCNFQKHLRMTNCSHIKSMKKVDTRQRRTSLDQETIGSSPSDFDSTTSPMTREDKQRRSSPSFDSPATNSSPGVSSVNDLSSSRSRTSTFKRNQPSSKSSPSRSAKRTRNRSTLK